MPSGTHNNAGILSEFHLKPQSSEVLLYIASFLVDESLWNLAMDGTGKWTVVSLIWGLRKIAHAKNLDNLPCPSPVKIGSVL